MGGPGEHPYLLRHDEGSSKHPMDSAVDYAAESSAFPLAVQRQNFQLAALPSRSEGCSFKQSSSPHRPVMPHYLEIRLGEPETSSMPTASFVGRTVDLVPQERLLRRC